MLPTDAFILVEVYQRETKIGSLKTTMSLMAFERVRYGALGGEAWSEPNQATWQLPDYAIPSPSAGESLESTSPAPVEMGKNEKVYDKRIIKNYGRCSALSNLFLASLSYPFLVTPSGLNLSKINDRFLSQRS